MEENKLFLLDKALNKFKSNNTPQEEFLNKKVWDFEFNHLARTYLFLRDSIELCLEKENCFIEGFFTLSPVYMKVKNNSNVEIDRDLLDKDGARTNGVLIGQLAKYKDKDYISPLNAKIILFYAEKMIREADEIVPFKTIVIETENEKVRKLYEKNGYSFFKTTQKTVVLYKRIF